MEVLVHCFPRSVPVTLGPGNVKVDKTPHALLRLAVEETWALGYNEQHTVKIYGYTGSIEEQLESLQLERSEKNLG